MSDSVWPHRRQPTRLPRPWDSPGKNTGVGRRFLLQCMKVKSQSEVAQSCLTLRDPMEVLFWYWLKVCTLRIGSEILFSLVFALFGVWSVFFIHIVPGFCSRGSLLEWAHMDLWGIWSTTFGIYSIDMASGKFISSFLVENV